MRKEILISVAVFLAVVLLSMSIFYFTTDTVSGAIAFELATNHPLYWIGIVSAVAGSGLSIYLAIRFNVTGIAVNFIAAGIAIALCVSIFMFPGKIKTDPISSGISTEEINYLRENGLK